MGLSINIVHEIETVLKNALRNKFQNYTPEPAVMPFHTRLLGKDRMALFSFIHSLNTNFGTTIFEPIAKALAKTSFVTAESQQVVGDQISSEAQRVIQNIMNDLTVAASTPNKVSEISRIRAVCQQGEMQTIRATNVDLKLIDSKNTLFLLDIKTAKPNAGGFKEFKRTLLEWVAITLAKNPNLDIQTMIVIPYNPYAPKPYTRWTIRGMLDLDAELKVAEEFWDFLSGKGTYDELLNIFERVGVELRSEIDEYFAKYRKLL